MDEGNDAFRGGSFVSVYEFGESNGSAGAGLYPWDHLLFGFVSLHGQDRYGGKLPQKVLLDLCFFSGVRIVHGEQ